MLQLNDLYKTFNKGTVNENNLYRGLSLTINEGDFVTIIGGNGAGKSTLLNLVSGKIDPDEGSIFLGGADITHMPEFRKAKSIARVFQDPSKGTCPSMTILENMSLAYNKGKLYGLSRGASKKQAGLFAELLSQIGIGLEDKLHTKVSLLSGGQRQALSLIMSTMTSPELLLLDEHTAALDPKTSEVIINLTEKIVTEKKITTLMVTHNMNHAMKMGNRLLMMQRGRIAIDICGEEKQNLTQEKLLSMFEKAGCGDEVSDRMLLA
ncbi:MAG: ATP-binding cassette domain-containing protein [Peptoclostridium sp.]|uniref:ABC transporter ATP-binding protein n=1 Tax=Peptoclostridium sp. TaxID=1904860 RepID=UPI00139E2895|nr:ATP-binding cassette domain-containing protein [Peptoclostridium sp.]MZQ75542.1 ATP-binding cassette domain-containing protein [Peptoclostridium sp.]